MFFILVLTVVVVVTAQTTTTTGYLIDNYCLRAPGFIAADGVNVSSTPERHTVACALMPPCVASGYCLVTAAAPHTISYTLDAPSNTLAVTFLETLTRRDNILVTVTGVISQPGPNFTVTSIRDEGNATVPPATPAPPGYALVNAVRITMAFDYSTTWSSALASGLRSTIANALAWNADEVVANYESGGMGVVVGYLRPFQEIATTTDKLQQILRVVVTLRRGTPSSLDAYRLIEGDAAVVVQVLEPTVSPRPPVVTSPPDDWGGLTATQAFIVAIVLLGLCVVASCFIRTTRRSRTMAAGALDEPMLSDGELRQEAAAGQGAPRRRPSFRGVDTV